MTTDPRIVAAAWHPQYPGRGSTSKLVDPIVEPDWAGLRVVAAIERGAAEVYRYGDRIDVPVPLEVALGRAFGSAAGVIEGHLTRQPFEAGTGASLARDLAPRTMFSLPVFFQRRANDPYLVGRRHQAEEEARAQPFLRALADGEEHAFVATDLLWLDGQSLVDVPLLERKRQLESVLTQSRVVRVTPFARPRGSQLVSTWAALGFEHVFWRAANSRYLPGRENPDWVVVRAPRPSSRLIVPHAADAPADAEEPPDA
jgi:hypothetical protein